MKEAAREAITAERSAPQKLNTEGEKDTPVGESRLALPHLEKVFRLLSRGRHICLEDGEPYWALCENHSAFTALFAALGFRLIRHDRDFFYFDGDELSDAGGRMAVFMFVLIEYLADQAMSVEAELMQHEWSMTQLPHLQRDRYREIMAAVGVADEKTLRGVVQSLDRFGFAEQGGDTFKFRRPAHRFFDLCIAMAQSANQGGGA